MTNEQRADLRRWVIEEIKKGSDMKTTVKGLKGLGFLPATIRAYFKTFKEV